MEKFWTVTDENTKSTNSRSTRYPTIGKAIKEAERRLQQGVDEGRVNGVYIMEAVKFVKYEKRPIVVEDTTTQWTEEEEDELPQL